MLKVKRLQRATKLSFKTLKRKIVDFTVMTAFNGCSPKQKARINIQRRFVQLSINRKLNKILNYWS